MLDIFHRYFTANKILGSLIDFVLPKLIKEFQSEFCRFADCGAGIGHTSLHYQKLLMQNLSFDIQNHALISCYEPLPENFVQLVKLSNNNSIFKLNQCAVSDFVGKSGFQIPNRCSVDNQYWINGTSYNGFLSDCVSNDHIIVDTIRLENEDCLPFHFVKLDLQGGELKAIKGLGNNLHDVKLLCVETQLLHSDSTIDFLNKSGFITFFDRLAFGFSQKIDKVPVDRLGELGIIIDENHHGEDFASYCLGHVREYSSLIDSNTLVLKKHVSDALSNLGVNYMQTDIIAFNKNIFSSVMRYFL